MKKYEKIMFVCTDNTAISPMAEAIMNYLTKNCIDICSRGMVVLFSEPYNPKIYDILNEKDIYIKENHTKQLTNRDFTENTLVLVPSEHMKNSIYSEYDAAINTYTLREFVGLGGDIAEPFGQGMEAYRALFDELYEILTKVSEMIEL